jgi:hypothetical protein
MGRAGLALCVVAVGALAAAAATTADSGVQTAVPRALFYAGPLMTLVGFVFAILWKVWSSARWRWLWAGAGIWTVGLSLKAMWALLVNEPVIAALQTGVPPEFYVACRSVYIGLLTGVFQIGVTLAAALVWRRLTRWGHRAVGVGIGAGAFEAIVLGAAALVGFLVVHWSQGESGAGQTATAAAQVTPLLWLVRPVQRSIAILCHVSSRTLVLFGVARRRWAPVVYGFLFLTAVDAVAGYTHLAGWVGAISNWWFVLMLAPFAVISLPITTACVLQWPRVGRRVLSDKIATPIPSPVESP